MEGVGGRRQEAGEALGHPSTFEHWVTLQLPAAVESPAWENVPKSTETFLMVGYLGELQFLILLKKENLCVEIVDSGAFVPSMFSFAL